MGSGGIRSERRAELREKMAIQARIFAPKRSSAPNFRREKQEHPPVPAVFALDDLMTGAENLA